MRITNRVFPDAAQLTLTGTVTINNSRVTFSGARGRIFILWTLKCDNGVAAIANVVQLRPIGTAVPGAFAVVGGSHLGPAAGALTNLYAYGVFTDPPEGSVAEVQIEAGANTVDVPTNVGSMVIVSVPHTTDDGPVVTVT